MTPRRTHIRGSIVASAAAARLIEQQASMGSDGLPLIFQHTNPFYAGHRCGRMWGTTAAPLNQPALLHWCSRSVSEVEDPTGDGPNVWGHPGNHRCTCGEYHTQDQEPIVVCRFPARDVDGPECGARVDGLRREIITTRASLSRGIPARRYSVIRADPCGHVVRRGF